MTDQLAPSTSNQQTLLADIARRRRLNDWKFVRNSTASFGTLALCALLLPANWPITPVLAFGISFIFAAKAVGNLITQRNLEKARRELGKQRFLDNLKHNAARISKLTRGARLAMYCGIAASLVSGALFFSPHVAIATAVFNAANVVWGASGLLSIGVQDTRATISDLNSFAQKLLPATTTAAPTDDSSMPAAVATAPAAKAEFNGATNANEPAARVTYITPEQPALGP